jgi:hypothetical protein
MVAAGILVTCVSVLGSTAFLIMAANLPNPPPNSFWLPMSFWLEVVAIVGGVPFVIGLILLFTGLAVIRRSGTGGEGRQVAARPLD